MVKGAVCKTVITSSILVGSFPLTHNFFVLFHRRSLPELHLQTAA